LSDGPDLSGVSTSRVVYWTCPIPHWTSFLRHSLNMSGPLPNLSSGPDKSRISASREVYRTIKRGSPPPLFSWPLHKAETHSRIQILSSPTLSQVSNPQSLFLREDLSSPLSEPLDLSKSTSLFPSMTSIVFVTLGDSLP
jgi:hypothetical protein